MKNQTKSKIAYASNPDSQQRVPVSQKSVSFPVIGIGGFRGGLKAPGQFFANMLAGFGLESIVIQYLDPACEGILRKLPQRIAGTPVFIAISRMQVKPSCVCIIQSNKSMPIFNGALYLFGPLEMRGWQLQVGFFFRPLADDYHHRSIVKLMPDIGISVN